MRQNILSKTPAELKREIDSLSAAVERGGGVDKRMKTKLKQLENYYLKLLDIEKQEKVKREEEEKKALAAQQEQVPEYSYYDYMQ